MIKECEEVTSKWMKANKWFSGLPQTSVHWKQSTSSENIWRFSSKKSLKAEASASGSRVALCICNCVSVISLPIFTAISKYRKVILIWLLVTSISELCVKGESLLHFLNKHSPSPNSTYKCFYYCTLRSMASYLDKDHVTTKKNGITTPEPHVPGPYFG